MGGAIASFYAEIGLETSKLQTGLKNSKSSLQNFGKGVNDSVKSLTGFNVAQLSAAAAIGAVVNTVRKAVSEYVSYANAMKDGSRLTGIQIDQYSRLTQVADDVRISQEQLKTAFQIASRQGIDVSIEGIQKIADEYNSLTSPVEKAQLLLKDFGRGGADMGRLMELGADGIAKATAAVDSNLVVTEEAARKAEELRLSQDALNDAWTGAKNVIAQALIPGLTKLATGLFKVITYTQDLKSEFNLSSTELKNTANTWDDYAAGLVKAAQETGQLHGMSARMADALLDGKLSGEAYDKALKKLVIELGGLSKSSFAAKDDLDGLNQMAADGVVYFGDLSGTLKQLADDDMANAAAAAANLSDTLSSQMDLTLKLTDLTGDYTTKITDLKDEHQVLEDKLANLNLNFPYDKEGIAQATQDLQDNEAEIKKTADAYDEAQKRIVWDMMVAKLSIDGYTEAEFNWAMNTGVNMGIITQESADLAIALMADADKQIKAFEDAAAAAENYGLYIDALHSTDITVTTHYVSDYSGSSGVSGQGGSFEYLFGNANGGPAYANRPGWVGERGPEIFIPGMDGQVISNADILAALRQANGQSTTNSPTYNLNMHVNQANSQSVIWGFRAMQLQEQ